MKAIKYPRNMSLELISDKIKKYQDIKIVRTKAFMFQNIDSLF
jgi:hypothetical protein